MLINFESVCLTLFFFFFYGLLKWNIFETKRNVDKKKKIFDAEENEKNWSMKFSTKRGGPLGLEAADEVDVFLTSSFLGLAFVRFPGIPLVFAFHVEHTRFARIVISNSDL